MAGTHNNDKPKINCQNCENTYNASTELITHLNDKYFADSNLLPLICGSPDCWERYDSLSKGTRHFKKHIAGPKERRKKRKNYDEESGEVSAIRNES
jgi:hypothetical protein